jgi:Sigma-70 factor, region 1.1
MHVLSILQGDALKAVSLPLDLSDAAVKKLIRSAKKRGYVTRDQINSVLPSEEVNSKHQGRPRHVQWDGCQRSRDRGGQ